VKAPESVVPQDKPDAEVTTPAKCVPPGIVPPLVYQDEMRRAERAARIINRISMDTIRNAKAIAVIPGVKKAALVFGHRWGKGLLTRRGEDGRWIPPSYIEISGGNFGFQAGVQSTDLVLVFTDESAVKALLSGKLTLSADASAAAGPKGKKAKASVPIPLNSGIWAWSDSKGLFAGGSLDGAAVTIDDSSNARVYGKSISGDEILTHRRVEVNPAVSPFLNALEMRVSAPAVAQSTIEPSTETAAATPTPADPAADTPVD